MSDSKPPPSATPPPSLREFQPSAPPPPSLRELMSAASAAPPPRSKAWQRPVFLAVSAAIVVAVLVTAHAVMLPFVLAILIAYVLTPLVAWVERKRVSRAVAIIAVYAVVLGSIGIFLWGITPRVIHEMGNLRREAPVMASHVREQWIPAIQGKLRDVGLAPPAPVVDDTPPGHEPESAIVARPQADGSIAIDVGTGIAVTQTKSGYLIEPVKEKKEESFDANRIVADAIGKTFAYAQHNAIELARLGRDIIASVSRFIFIFFITLMLAAYIMLTRERILDFFESLVRPSSRASFGSLIARIDRGLSGVVRGQLVICLVNGVLSAIGFALVGLKYWPVLALIATVLSLIPIFGSIISSIPAVALGLTQSFGTALFVLGWILGIHQLEANFLNPKIMGDAAKIHPVMVVFSLLVGEHFFHTIGALLAVPCMSIAQSIFIHFRQIVQRSDPELASEPVGSLIPPPP